MRPTRRRRRRLLGHIIHHLQRNGRLCQKGLPRGGANNDSQRNLCRKRHPGQASGGSRTFHSRHLCPPAMTRSCPSSTRNLLRGLHRGLLASLRRCRSLSSTADRRHRSRRSCSCLSGDQLSRWSRHNGRRRCWRNRRDCRKSASIGLALQHHSSSHHRSRSQSQSRRLRIRRSLQMVSGPRLGPAVSQGPGLHQCFALKLQSLPVETQSGPGLQIRCHQSLPRGPRQGPLEQMLCQGHLAYRCNLGCLRQQRCGELRHGPRRRTGDVHPFQCSGRQLLAADLIRQQASYLLDQLAAPGAHLCAPTFGGRPPRLRPFCRRRLLQAQRRSHELFRMQTQRGARSTSPLWWSTSRMSPATMASAS